MYKIFLVDDEIVVREGIRDNVNWESTDFIFSGEASDGEVALPLIQEMKPDILVTDIKMPFMDGLQLSRIIKKSMPWIKIIILSGHDEFNFAKEAISIGVTEYLLKPISSADLLKALNKVAAQIENEKRERESIENLKVQLMSNAPLFREKFLNELSLGIIQPVEAIEKCGHFGINIISKYYIAAVIDLESREKSGKEYQEVLKVDTLISSIVDHNQDIIKFKRNMEETALIIKGDVSSSLEETAYSLAQSIKYEVERNTEFLLTIGIGSIRERIQGIVLSFADADTAKNYKYIFGKSKIIGIKDVKSDATAKSDLPKLDKTDLLDFLKCGSKSNIQEVLENYIQYLGEPNLKSLIYTYYAFMDIILTSSKFISEFGGDITELIPETANMEDILVNIESVSQFKEYAGKILEKVFDFRDQRIESKYGITINKAKEYINNNYTNPEISLNSIAAYVNISPSHFSTVFSQETGETFIEYLTKTRMKKAMELLKTTTQKSAEIAYNVGYNDPHYFSYIFKKVTGSTPKEFRSEG